MEAAFIQLVEYFGPGIVAFAVYSRATFFKARSNVDTLIIFFVFTLISRALGYLLHSALLFVGNLGLVVAPASASSLLAAEIISAILVGCLLSALSNLGYTNRLLKVLGSFRTDRFNVWLDTFSDECQWVMLHLKDDRRIWGCLESFSDTSNDDMVVLKWARWFDSEGYDAPDNVEMFKLMIRASEIRWVEIQPVIKEGDNERQEGATEAASSTNK